MGIVIAIFLIVVLIVGVLIACAAALLWVWFIAVRVAHALLRADKKLCAEPDRLPGEATGYAETAGRSAT